MGPLLCCLTRDKGKELLAQTHTGVRESHIGSSSNKSVVILDSLISYIRVPFFNYSNSKSSSFLPFDHQLTTFWRPWDKQLFISDNCDDLNRCTSCRWNLIHTTRTCPWQVVNNNLSPWVNRVAQIYCSWEKVLMTRSLAQLTNLRLLP
jgi:hypothetical protein